MKQIFVVERTDKQPFSIYLNEVGSGQPLGGSAVTSKMITVTGVGFASHDEADTFLHIVGDHQTFSVMMVVENRSPMDPNFSPASNQIN